MMLIQKYLILSVALITNRIIHATEVAEDCDDSSLQSTGYYASGSAHSSQFIAPTGYVQTQAHGSSLSSDGIHKTFQQLKHGADRFVKQKDDSVLSASSSSQNYGTSHFANAQNYISQLQNSANQHLVQQYQVPVPQASEISSVHKEEHAKKTVITQGSSLHPVVVPSGLETFSQVRNAQQNQHKDIELVETASSVPSTDCCYGVLQTCCVVPTITKVEAPASASQSSSSSYKYESEQRNSSQLQPSVLPNVQRGVFTYGVLDLNANNQNYQQGNQVQGLHEYISRNVPSKIVVETPTERHYPREENFNQNTIVNTQKEQKYHAVPIVHTPTIVQQHTFDSKNQIKNEEFNIGASGYVQPVPVVVQQPTINQQRFVESSDNNARVTNNEYYPVSHISNVVVKVKPNVETYHKEESHASQTITSNNAQPVVKVVEKYVRPQIDESQQYVGSSNYFSTGNQYDGSSAYQVPVAPIQTSSSAHSSSQSHEKQSSSRSQSYQGINSPVLLQGVPQAVPIEDQHYSSSGSGSSYYSSGSGGSALYDRLAKINQSGGSKLLCQDECISYLGSPSVPVKSTYGVSTSYSHNASNINGQKTENRQASVSVNDNGKVDSYNVKS